MVIYNAAKRFTEVNGFILGSVEVTADDVRKLVSASVELPLSHKQTE